MATDGHRRVLLVEPDSVAAKVSLFWLERAGFHVQRVCVAEEALATAAASLPQVAVIALLLPDMDGWSLLRRLRAAQPGLPAVMVSEIERHHPATGESEAEYVTRPAEGAALVRAVRRALRRAGCGGLLPRLLLAHDDEGALRQIGGQLADAGFDVVEALGTREACVLAEMAPFAAVVIGVGDADHLMECLGPRIDAAAPWVRLGERPRRGDWKAVAGTPAELSSAVERLFAAPCSQD